MMIWFVINHSACPSLQCNIQRHHDLQPDPGDTFSQSPCGHQHSLQHMCLLCFFRQRQNESPRKDKGLLCNCQYLPLSNDRCRVFYTAKTVANKKFVEWTDWKAENTYRCKSVFKPRKANEDIDVILLFSINLWTTSIQLVLEYIWPITTAVHKETYSTLFMHMLHLPDKYLQVFQVW